MQKKSKMIKKYKNIPSFTCHTLLSEKQHIPPFLDNSLSRYTLAPIRVIMSWKKKFISIKHFNCHIFKPSFPIIGNAYTFSK